MYIDPTYYIFITPGLILGIIAQFWITTSSKKYLKVSSGSNITGREAAEIISQNEDLPVSLVVEGGLLSDHFDPRKDVVKLSQAALYDSVTAIAVAAHEFGHVQQKFDRSPLFIVRSGLVPIVNIGSTLGYILIIAGLLLNLLGLAELGLLFFATTTVFAFVTLPVELDASKRAMNLIEKYQLIDRSRIKGARSVLNAAATTYVASLLTSFLNLLYYASLVNRRRK